MFDILEFISRIFKKDRFESSSSCARERLKLVLVSDRASISPHLMEILKEELIEVISKYMTIDKSAMEMGIERKNGSLALAANIPIVDVKRIRSGKKLLYSSSPESFAPSQMAAPLVESFNFSSREEIFTANNIEKQEEPVPAKLEKVGEKIPEILPEKDKIENFQKKRGRRTGRRFQVRALGRNIRKRVLS